MNRCDLTIVPAEAGGTTASTGRYVLRAALVLLPAVAALALLAWWQWDRLASLPAMDVQEVDRLIAAWGTWAAVASIGLMVLHSVLPLPGEIIAVANGMMFGPVRGTLLTWSGAMLGAALSFAIGRHLGRPALRWLVPPTHLASLEGWDCRPTFLLLIRLVPVISFNLINYAAGLTAVSWWTFLWTTGLGILPITAGSVILGHAIWGSSWAVWLGVAAGFLLLALVLHRLRPALLRRPRGDADGDGDSGH